MGMLGLTSASNRTGVYNATPPEESISEEKPKKFMSGMRARFGRRSTDSSKSKSSSPSRKLVRKRSVFPSEATRNVYGINPTNQDGAISSAEAVTLRQVKAQEVLIKPLSERKEGHTGEDVTIESSRADMANTNTPKLSRTEDAAAIEAARAHIAEMQAAISRIEGLTIGNQDTSVLHIKSPGKSPRQAKFTSGRALIPLKLAPIQFLPAKIPRAQRRSSHSQCAHHLEATGSETEKEKAGEEDHATISSLDTISGPCHYNPSETSRIAKAEAFRFGATMTMRIRSASYERETRFPSSYSPSASAGSSSPLDFEERSHTSQSNHLLTAPRTFDPVTVDQRARATAILDQFYALNPSARPQNCQLSGYFGDEEGVEGEECLEDGDDGMEQTGEDDVEEIEGSDDNGWDLEEVEDVEDETQ